MNIDFDLGTVTNGWICESCGTFVAWGIEHVCPGKTVFPSIYDASVIYPPAFEEDPNVEINRKLDEILKLLRKNK